MKELFGKFRIVLYLYALAVLSYVLFFVLLRKWTYAFLGESFATSLSASMLWDLIFFIFIGFLVSLISIIISQKTPEDFEFERRVLSLANSDFARDNLEVKNHLISVAKNLLIYYRKFDIVITLKEYDAASHTYLVYLQRTQYVANMSKDIQYHNPSSSISIDADKDVNNDYGQINYCKVFDSMTGRSVHTDCDETSSIPLQKGFNKRSFPLTIEPNKDCGIKFGYNFWQITGNKEDRDHCIYFKTARLTTNINIVLKHKIPKHTVNYDIRIKSYERNTVNHLYTDETLDYNVDRTINNQTLCLSPNEVLEFYFHPPTP